MVYIAANGGQNKPNTTGNVSDTHSIIKILRLDIKVNAESEQGWMCYVLYKQNFQLPSTKKEESEKYLPIIEKYFPPTQKYIAANGAKCIQYTQYHKNFTTWYKSQCRE